MILTYSQRGDLLAAQSLPYEAIAHYEKSLSHFPDHPSAIVGLSTLLLSISAKEIPAEAPEPPLFPSMASLPATPAVPIVPTTPDTTAASPEELNRLAARDRAYGLLSSLTKLGSGWDYSEAWFGLARCYELSNQVEKAKEVLWWCVELEDTRPIRPWGCVRGGS